MITGLRLRKLARDVWVTRVRVAMMVAVIALSVTAIGAFLTAGAVLGREISRNYLATRPASATLLVPGGVDAQTLAAATAQPDVLAAAARASAPGRVRVNNGPWRLLVLFATPPGDPGQIATVAPGLGTWPPPEDGLFLERTALEFLGVRVGDRVVVSVGGPATPVTVAGTVHDGGVAPAGQEQTAYGYLTTTALARLGGPATVDQLKIVVGDAAGPSSDPARIGAVAQRVATMLGQRGQPVSHIDIPPPLRHPHQGQMVMVRFVLLTFGLTSLLLSSVLVATMLGGAIAAQIRQIGAMKAVGARTGQVLSMYLWQAAAIASAATLLGLPAGVLLGRLLAGVGAGLLNLDLASPSPPAWVYAVVMAAGIAVPLLVALVPLVRGARITVRQAIEDYGSQPGGGTRPRLRLPGFGRSQAMAARNMVRRRGRLALNLGLLAVAGTMLLTGLNTAGGWAALVDNGIGHRNYDLELHLTTPIAPAAVADLVESIAGVRDAEAWGNSQTWVHSPGRVDVSRVYPDEGHASFTVLAPPADTPLLRLPVLAGRWLRPDDTGAVVLNHLVPLQQAPGIGVGDSITLTIEGRPSTWRVVGIADDFGTQGTAYLTDREYAAATDTAGMGMLRVATAEHDPAARLATLDRIEDRLGAAGVGIERSLTIDDLQVALEGHVLVLIDALLAIAVIVAAVGLLGLAAAMSTAVTERTREFAILHVIGATPAYVRGVVLTEGVFIGALSVLTAALAALPLTRLFGDFIGIQAFAQPLPYEFSTTALVALMLLAILGTALASVAAARRASRLTVREALTTL